MSKLTSLLLANGILTKASPSGSEYYSISNKKVRISDHLAPIVDTECLNIILPQQTKKQYIVIFMGNFYIHSSFTSLRVFLENWILISKQYAKRLNCLECAAVKGIQKQLLNAQKLIAEQQTEILSLKKPSIVYDMTDFDDLTKNQKAALLKSDSIGESLKKQIDGFRKENEINRLKKK